MKRLLIVAAIALAGLAWTPVLAHGKAAGGTGTGTHGATRPGNGTTHHVSRGHTGSAPGGSGAKIGVGAGTRTHTGSGGKGSGGSR